MLEINRGCHIFVEAKKDEIDEDGGRSSTKVQRLERTSYASLSRKQIE